MTDHGDDLPIHYGSVTIGRRTREQFHSGSLPALEETSCIPTTWEWLRIHLRNSLLDYQAAWFVFWFHLITIDTVIYMVFAAAITCAFRYIPGGKFKVPISWNLFAFAVVFPITWNISTAYRRRDDALHRLGSIKALIFSLFAAHRDWNWENAQGRGKLNPSDIGHVCEVSEELGSMVDHMTAFFLLPCVNKSRHLYTAAGRKVRQEVRPIWKTHLAGVQASLNRLSVATERMKLAGMPANEAARINQYIMLIAERFNQLRYIKGYRTPEGIRSFAR